MPFDSLSVLELKLLLYLIIVCSAVFHEYMHAWTAFVLGDPTAKYAGRLTLNPLRHLDTWGTVILPLFLLFFVGAFIGWAKPVPYNPYNLKSQRWGSALVGIAGPATNMFLAVVFGLLLRFHYLLPTGEASFYGAMASLFPLIVRVNIFLALFNLLPIPPLDGSKFFAAYLPRSLQLLFAANPFLAFFVAISLAMLILPYLSAFFYTLIVGSPMTF